MVGISMTRTIFRKLLGVRTNTRLNLPPPSDHPPDQIPQLSLISSISSTKELFVEISGDSSAKEGSAIHVEEAAEAVEEIKNIPAIKSIPSQDSTTHNFKEVRSIRSRDSSIHDAVEARHISPRDSSTDHVEEFRCIRSQDNSTNDVKEVRSTQTRDEVRSIRSQDNNTNDEKEVRSIRSRGSNTHDKNEERLLFGNAEVAPEDLLSEDKEISKNSMDSNQQSETVRDSMQQLDAPIVSKRGIHYSTGSEHASERITTPSTNRDANDINAVLKELRHDEKLEIEPNPSEGELLCPSGLNENLELVLAVLSLPLPYVVDETRCEDSARSLSTPLSSRMMDETRCEELTLCVTTPSSTPEFLPVVDETRCEEGAESAVIIEEVLDISTTNSVLLRGRATNEVRERVVFDSVDVEAEVILLEGKREILDSIHESAESGELEQRLYALDTVDTENSRNTVFSMSTSSFSSAELNCGEEDETSQEEDGSSFLCFRDQKAEDNRINRGERSIEYWMMGCVQEYDNFLSRDSFYDDEQSTR